MKPCAFIEKLNAGEKQLIVTYGTSLTAEGAWVTSLWNALETKYPGQATVVNSGKNAMCSIWGLDNLQERVLLPMPPYVMAIHYQKVPEVLRRGHRPALLQCHSDQEG